MIPIFSQSFFMKFFTRYEVIAYHRGRKLFAKSFLSGMRR
jgi:hypothetical protein